MAHYRRVGSVPPKRHSQHRQPDGSLYLEELMGSDGFSADSVAAVPPPRPLGHHRREGRGTRPGSATRANLPLLPRHLRLHELFPARSGSAATP